jgi:hypothetical protein
MAQHLAPSTCPKNRDAAIRARADLDRRKANRKKVKRSGGAACTRALMKRTVKERLEYLRGEIEAECISYGEIAELQSLAKHIDPGDMLLLEWAGVPEKATRR